MSFDQQFVDLTQKFAHAAGAGIVTGAVFDLATGGDRLEKDPEMKIAKPLMKMMLGGLLM